MLIAPGSTDVSVYMKLVNPTTGVPVTGATITNLDATYIRDRATASKADLTALDAADSAHADSKAIEVDGTNAPGVYRVDWPDAAFAAGSARVQLVVNGAAIDPAVIEVELAAWLTAVTGTTVLADTTLISGDSTAADNCELMFDGTGYAGGTTKLDVNTATIANGAITAAAVATGAIDADAIADNAIDAGAIATGAITNAKFAAGAIDAAAIANGAIDAATFAAGAIDATAIATGAIDADALAADAVDEILDEVVEGTVTVRQALKLLLSFVGAKASGAGTATVTFRDVGDTKARITMTVDADGNRTAVVLDGA